MSFEPRGRGRRRDRGILWALGLSVLLHLLVFLVGPWIPIASMTAAVPEEETAVTFRFDAPAPPPEPEPPPAEPEPQAPPAPEPEPEPEPLLRPEPVEGVGPLTETPGAPPEPVDDVREEVPIEPEPAGAERSPAPQPAPEPIEPAPRRLDIGRALREFEDSLNERPPALEPEARRGPAPRNDFRPDVPTLSSTFGMGNLVFESGDYDWTDYARQVLVILERAVNRRIFVTLDDFERWAHENRVWVIRPDQRVRVRFVIERSGEIVGIRIEGSSGVTPFDAAVEDGLAEAILPPLPSDFPRDREVVHIEGLFPRGAPILQLRPAYRRWKAMGLF